MGFLLLIECISESFAGCLWVLPYLLLESLNVFVIVRVRVVGITVHSRFLLGYVPIISY